jgi:uncharacterized protein YgbK (DUF1537 family)
MIKLLVIADDLTGALDAGVHFAERGITTEVNPVFNNASTEVKPEESVEVVVINTESRHIQADEASRLVILAARYGMDHGAKFIYKKTDSTLRGNLGAELEALMEATRENRIPFIPAYPALNRYTRKGYHYIGDQFLHQTRFAEDPLEPVTSSFIPEILNRQTLCKIGLYSFPFYQDVSLSENDEREILVFDCSSDLDMERIGSFLEVQKRLKIVAGSAGFASVLAEKLSFYSTPVESIGNPGTCLIINGSLNPVSLEQVRVMEKSSMKCIHLEPEFLNSESDQQEQWDRLIGKAINVLQDESFLLVSSTRSLVDLKGYLKNKHSESITKDIYSAAARRFGHFIAKILNTCDIGMMIVVGGDTLMALVSEMHIPFLHPIKEVLPGVVLSKMKIKGQSTYLVTKPGGYGEKDTLFRIIHHIKNQKI